jgi:hypothetical protein
MVLFPIVERIPNRRDPGGRREVEFFIRGFMFLVFWKKILCGLSVLCG